MHTHCLWTSPKALTAGRAEKIWVRPSKDDSHWLWGWILLLKDIKGGAPYFWGVILFAIPTGFYPSGWSLNVRSKGLGHFSHLLIPRSRNKPYIYYLHPWLVYLISGHLHLGCKMTLDIPSQTGSSRETSLVSYSPTHFISNSLVSLDCSSSQIYYESILLISMFPTPLSSPMA